ESSATSTVTIGAATLTAGRDVRVSANSVSSAQMKAFSAFLGVTWVHSAASATATVGSGANVSAGANFALTADVTNTMTAKTYVVAGLAGVPQGPSVSVSVGKAESTSRAVVQSGATISAGNVDVKANNKNTFETATTSLVLDPDDVGAGVGVSLGYYSS